MRLDVMGAYHGGEYTNNIPVLQVKGYNCSDAEKRGWDYDKQISRRVNREYPAGLFIVLDAGEEIKRSLEPHRG